MTDPVKTDPQCWAKNAIVKALKDLNHDDPAVFLRGIEHVQMEPVWGGRWPIPPIASWRLRAGAGGVFARPANDSHAPGGSDGR